MRLLPDTNVFITYWNDYNGLADTYEEIMKREDVFLCGVVRAELLHGAMSEKHLRSMTSMFDSFDEINLKDDDWQSLGENLYKIKVGGFTVPISDAIIATVAIRNQLKVWSNDKHFKMMQTILGGLEIYDQ